MEGVVVRVIREKRFGFIRSVGEGADAIQEFFFHRDDFNGFFEDLVEDIERKRVIKVSFDSVPSQKGLRAGNVIRLDDGI